MFLSPVNLRKLQHFHGVSSSHLPKRRSFKEDHPEKHTTVSSAAITDHVGDDGRRRSKRQKRVEICVDELPNPSILLPQKGPCIDERVLQICRQILGKAVVDDRVKEIPNTSVLFVILRFEALFQTLKLLDANTGGSSNCRGKTLSREMSWISQKLSLLKKLSKDAAA
jgi:hypothetical protein